MYPAGVAAPAIYPLNEGHSKAEDSVITCLLKKEGFPHLGDSGFVEVLHPTGVEKAGLSHLDMINILQLKCALFVQFVF